MLLPFFAAAALASSGACPTGLFQSTDSKARVVITSRQNEYRYTYLDGRRGTVGTNGGGGLSGIYRRARKR